MSIQTMMPNLVISFIDKEFYKETYGIIHGAPLTSSYLETHKRFIGKQCRPRSDAT